MPAAPLITRSRHHPAFAATRPHCRLGGASPPAARAPRSARSPKCTASPAAHSPSAGSAGDSAVERRLNGRGRRYLLDRARAAAGLRAPGAASGVLARRCWAGSGRSGEERRRAGGGRPLYCKMGAASPDLELIHLPTSPFSQRVGAPARPFRRGVASARHAGVPAGVRWQRVGDCVTLLCLRRGGRCNTTANLTRSGNTRPPWGSSGCRRRRANSSPKTQSRHLSFSRRTVGPSAFHILASQDACTAYLAYGRCFVWLGCPLLKPQI